ncbi:hypothetical protein RvY_11515 [Ramazzottius varieornatus]|uniref:Uncharacterized protein n=1 Tax=Ramazzottius varieornatus TaxID=947166 RepID=A0A1D1VGD5_RAMVA|nr:hypothetical protein RvY_11515 [Ramazzottius varieornatus]
MRTLTFAEKRDAATVLAASHHSKATILSIDSNPFSTTTACVLSPEISMGPYWVQGELIRNDLRQTQPGIYLHLDIQLIDGNTCQPVSHAHLEYLGMQRYRNLFRCHRRNTGNNRQTSARAADADPVMNYVLLGNSLTDGILGWITMGVDRSADHSDMVYAASKWTKDGGLDLQLGDK